MFAYAHGSEAAKKIVRSILSERGSFFKKGLLKTEVGANFFLSLVEADTEAGLDFLEATIGKQSREQLLQFEAGRQRVVWALEKIAVERAFFQRAARLLLRLAEAENNPAISNNATGTFAALFSLGPGRTAPTQAPPAERFPVLEVALNSESKEVRSVALLACDQALKSHSFTRMYGAERRGLKDLELWSPKTYDEWYQAYRQVWELLWARVPTLPDAEQSEAARVLLKHAFDLVQIERLEGVITATVGELAIQANPSRKELLETVLDVLNRLDTLPEMVKRSWKRIEEVIAGGTDFQARLKRHVTLPPWRLAPEAGSFTAPWRPLAEEAITRPDQLLAQLDWLTTGEAESAAAFGYELGRIDREFVFERPIADAVQRSGPDGNPGLIGGYLRGIHELDPKRWLSVIEHLSEGPETKRLFPGVVMQSGLTDDAAVILARLVRNKDMPAHYLQGFIFGGEIRNLSVTSFQSWIELLLQENDQRALVAALQLLHHFFLRDQVLDHPSNLFEPVLLHETLFEPEGPETRGSHRDYDWSQLARMYLQDHPDRKLVVAQRMLESMGKDSVVMPRFGHSYAHQLLLEIAKEVPHAVWGLTAPLLGPPIDSRAYSIQSWLRGGEPSFGGGKDAESVLTYIPLQDLWDWVDQDFDHRAWYLASFVPKDLVNHPSRPSVAREMLIRYGDRDDVQRSLIANYSTEGWMGPESEHHRSKKEELERLLDTEPELRVREWLNRYVGYLRKSVEQARMEEERENL